MQKRSTSIKMMQGRNCRDKKGTAQSIKPILATLLWFCYGLRIYGCQLELAQWHLLMILLLTEAKA